MDIFAKIAEERIKEAMERGEFDNLPGKGKPLPMDDMSVPEDLRLAYKILKNSGFLPPELEELKEIKNMEDLIKNIKDEGEKYKQIKKLNLMIAKFNMKRKRPIYLEVNQVYYEKVLDRLT